MKAADMFDLNNAMMKKSQSPLQIVNSHDVFLSSVKSNIEEIIEGRSEQSNLLYGNLQNLIIQNQETKILNARANGIQRLEI